MATRIAALVGEGGFCALLGRAIRTLGSRYEWLSMTPGASIDASLGALERDMASTDPAIAAIANRELLETFTRQLVTLIGEALTRRLLEEAGTPAQDGQEDGQEQK